VPTTREDRIRAQANALARRGAGCYGDHGCRKHWISMNEHVYMPLARQWKMPVREIKRIVKGETDGPANA
jgi:hypothetical protein